MIPMKRVLDEAGPGSAEKRQRRQDPVSCHFCRTKKLKCDRSFPCSNCRARGLNCMSAKDAKDTLPMAPALASENNSRRRVNSPRASLSHQQEDLESRVRRIEDYLGFSKAGPSSSSFSTERRSIGGGQRPGDTRHDDRPNSSDDDEMTRTAAELEANVFDNQTTAIAPKNGDYSTFSYRFQASLLPFALSGLQPRWNAQRIATMLPSRSEADQLLDVFIENVNWIYHIFHIPTVRKQLDAVYTDIESLKYPNSGLLAVISAILSLGAYFSSHTTEWTRHQTLLPQCEQIMAMSQYALMDANYISHPTLETVQALTLLAIFLPNLGATAAFLVLRAVCVNSASSLGLHQIDSNEQTRQRKKHGCNLVDLETKRRLWWHLASSDWILLCMGGPYSNIYQVNPKHMRVNYPANVDDTDLTPDSCPDRPLTEPSEMTYNMFRIQLAEIFREIVDVANAAGGDLEDLKYEQVLFFDRKLHDFMASTPFFFSIDEKHKAQREELDLKHPYLRPQRFWAQLGFHTRLCRLHRPWLARGSRDPRFAYSRMTCLKSARTVIEMERQLSAQNAGRAETSRAWPIIHHHFVSTIVLVMDYCYNRDEPQAAQRKEEILECFRVLERFKSSSAIADNGVEQLKKVLNRSKAKVGKHTDAKEKVAVVAANPSVNTGYYDSNIMNSPDMPVAADGLWQQMSETPQSIEELSTLNDAWLDSFVFDNNLDSSGWESLLQGLEGQSAAYQ